MKIASDQWFTELAGDVDSDLLAIAKGLEETYIGKYEGTLMGASSAVAILEVIVIRWREHVESVCEGNENRLLEFEDAVQNLREDLLKRVFIARVSPAES
jgi:hypothetical protein